MAEPTQQRLTELARKAWPVSAATAEVHIDERSVTILDVDGSEHAELLYLSGENASYAALAALLVLSGECPIRRHRRESLSDEAPSAALDQLSPRERDVVRGLCSGMRLSDVAKTMGVSNHTARNHLKHTFRKLGLHSQNELIAKLGGRHV